jgi:hypothetical protein
MTPNAVVRGRFRVEQSAYIGAGSHYIDAMAPDTPLRVGTRVRVVDGSNRTGQIVEDFGALAGAQVVVDASLTARARRWAVALDDGGIAFVDDDAIEPIAAD